MPVQPGGDDQRLCTSRASDDLPIGARNKTEEEIAAYNEALKLDAIWGNVFNDLGYSYLKIGDFNNAEKAFQKNASLNPDDSNAFDSLGELYFIMGIQ